MSPIFVSLIFAFFYNSEFTKAKPKEYPVAPKNNADVEKNLRQAKNNDPDLTHLNWNNIMVS